MKTLLAIALSLSALVVLGRAGENPVISADDAKSHIGEAATVKGTVAQIIKGPKAVFLNFGGAYPKQTFTAVSSNLPFSALSSFEGKIISVSGTIKDNNGKPEIVVTNSTQITAP